MNILITGGAGYIGSVVTQLMLAAGHNVKVIDTLWFNKDIPLIHCGNPKYKFIKGDIRDTKLIGNVLGEGVDCIIHMAAVVGEPASNKFPELTCDINYKGSVNLISKAQEYGVKGFIFFSTCSNYGCSDSVATEETPLKPLSVYAETKINVEKYLMDNTTKFDWIIFRLSTAYGISPRMRFDLTVNDFTMNAYLKKFLEIFLPYTYRPYMHVYDIAEVVAEMVKNFQMCKNNVFNLGFNSENYQKIKIVEIIKEFVPDVTIEIVNTGRDLRDYQVDFSKLKKYLNIVNKYTIRDGVKEVIRLLKEGIIDNLQDKIYYNTCIEPETVNEIGIRCP